MDIPDLVEQQKLTFISFFQCCLEDLPSVMDDRDRYREGEIVREGQRNLHCRYLLMTMLKSWVKNLN